MPTNVVPRYQTPTTPNRLPDMIDRLFRDSFVLPAFTDRFYDGHSGLTNNLLETDDAYVVEFVLPGANPDKFELKITGRELIVKGIIEVPMPEGYTLDKVGYIWHGFDGGEFTQTYTLPTEVQGEMVKAEFIHGILMITVPKAESVKPRTVKVLVK